MTKDDIRDLLNQCLEKESKGFDLVLQKEWENIENHFMCQLPDEFKYFIELMSEYSFPGDILNVSTGKTNGNDTIIFTYNFELKEGLWKKELIPFYSIGNGDYFCLNANECPNTGVYYYCHEDQNINKENDNFSEWLLRLPKFLG